MKRQFGILFLIGFTFVAAQSANDAIRRLQHKFNSINNFTAEFSQGVFTTKGDDQGKSLGKFFYKKKNKFIVELKNQIIISDGSNVWNYDKKFKRVVISYLVDDPTSFSLEKFIYDYPGLCKSRLLKDNSASENEDIIVLTPKDNDLQFKEVKIWKNSDNLISKMELTDLGDMKYSFSFSDLKTNIELPDHNFTFTPPKGTKIIDLR